MSTLRKTILATTLGCVTACLMMAVPARANEDAEPVTFNNQVIRILQKSCQSCHRPNQVAPMSLLTYKEARPWAKAIRTKVESREMPPWSADPAIGDYANDRSLTTEEIATLVQWVDGGAREGEPSDLPPPVQWPEGWAIGEPDLILSAEKYRVPAHGSDRFEYFSIETGMKEDRFISAVQVIPGDARVVHHVMAYIHQNDSYDFSEEESWSDSIGNGGTILTEYGVGNNGDVFPEGTGRLLKRGARLWLQTHYHPYGESVTDQTRIALKFHPKGSESQRIITRLIGTRDLSIPPNKKDVASYGQYRFRRPVRIISFQPHMHCRGQAMNATVRYPDGRTEVLFSVPDFDFNWQTTYTYRNPPLIPAGATLSVTAMHDNTRGNPNNPNPDQYVYWGQETTDEMMHLWTDFVYADEGFPVPVTERPVLHEKSDKAPVQTATRVEHPIDAMPTDTRIESMIRNVQPRRQEPPLAAEPASNPWRAVRPAIGLLLLGTLAGLVVFARRASR